MDFGVCQLLLFLVVLHGVCAVDLDYRDDYPEDGNCSRCGERGERRMMRLQMIKQQILSQLGLREAPNVTARLPHVPPLDSLLDHYAMQADAPAFVPGPEYGDEDEFYLSTHKVLSFPKHPPMNVALSSKDQQLYFQLPANLQHSQIQSAQLWVHLRPTRHSLHFNLTLEQVEMNLSTGQIDFLQIKRKLDKKHKPGHWLVFDVKKSVNHWLKKPSENFGFLLHSPNVNLTDLIGLSGGNSQSKKPFLETRVDKQKQRRVKRMIGLNCEEDSSEVRCCRYPLTVDFEEFGWDWIIAPKRYEANYCSGECPYVFLQKYPHTHLVQQANPQGSAGPCCAPRKMSAISMLYFDSEFNIIYGMLPGMVVDRCGCS